MNRKNISKAIREDVYNKYGGRCAYCGEKIAVKDMQIDHLAPLSRNGADNVENYMPACRMCNHYKHTLTIEDFRRQISLLTKRLKEREYIYNLAIKHGRLIEVDNPVVFYFEKQRTESEDG